MSEVPRIVRERLRVQEPEGAHPDANLLSAFAEQALTEHERERVLNHVALCAECREVLALSAPQPDEKPALAAPAALAGTRWWRSPVVHWGGLTAAALVVLIAVATRMQLRSGHSASAPAIATYGPAQQSQAQRPESAQSPPDQKVADKAPSPRPAKPLNRTVPSAVGGVSEGVRDRTVSAAENCAPPPAAAAAPAVKTQATADTLSAEAPPPQEKRSVGESEKKAIPAPLAAQTCPDEVAGGSAGGLKRETTILAPRSAAPFAKRAALGTRWSISESGAVQRSIDGGRSWKEVSIADGVTFRAVATVGNDVWAGGSLGALYHSTDGGERWSPVRVQSNVQVLGGDIVRIEFTSIRAGLLSTSTGEIWTTTDAGVTWQRQ
ncbi:MAG TPA: YCF48-related protein [Terriglobales bacterium]|nr:YCF48-related protein [Terriglobales bacterium]